MLKIIVKIGLNPSKLNITNCDLYRSITPTELEYAIKALPDYNLIIVEDIDKEEYEQMKGILKSFCADENHNVIFFIPTNDAETSGLADELEKNIYLTQEDLCNAIYNKYNINISTSVDLRRKYNSSEISDIVDAEIPDVFDIDDFGEEDEQSAKNDAELIIDKNEVFDYSAIENVETKSVDTEKIRDTQDKLEAALKDADSAKLEIKKLQREIEELSKYKEDANKTIETQKGEIRTLKDESKNSIDSLNIKLGDATKTIEELKKTNAEQLEAAEKQNKTIEELKKSNQEQITNSENKFKKLQEEKDRQVKELGDKLEAANRQLESDRDNYRQNIEDLKKESKDVSENINSQALAQIDALKIIIEEKDADIKAKEEEITSVKSESESTKENLQKSLDDANKKVSETQEISDKLQKSLDDANNQIQELNNKISSDSSSNETTIRELNDKIEKLNEEHQTKIDEYIANERKQKEEIAARDDKIEQQKEEIARHIEENRKNQEEISKLSQVEVTDEFKQKYNDTVDKLRVSNSQVDKLKEEVEALKQEKDFIKKTYDDIIQTSDVIEEPITLAEYDAINKELEQSKKDLENSKNKVSRLQADMTESSEKSAEELRSTQQKLDEAQSRLNELNASIESGDIHQELIYKHKNEMDKLTREKDIFKNGYDDLTDSYNKLTEKYRNTSRSLDEEREYREIYSGIIERAFKKSDKNDNKQQEEIAELKKKAEDAEKQKNEAIEKMEVEKKELLENAESKKQEALEDSDAKIKELTEELKASKDDKEVIRTELNDTKTQLRETKSELNTLKVQSGGTAELVETNKMLESNVRRLSGESEKYKREAEKYKTLSEELSVKVKLGGGSEGGAVGKDVDNILSAISYNGKAKIITVFGSGSFGITTTAISLAYKMYPSSRVLFIDFDFANPNADEFMSIMPMCKDIPGYSNNDVRASSLGIVYDKGMDALRGYYQALIKHKESTRNGCLDYMSGTYYRVTDYKLLSLNYSEFFNFLGSMYDYIIIDMGKFGSGEVKDTLLKRFISMNNSSAVAVTQFNMFKIRNFMAALKGYGLNVGNMQFILNMCDSTALKDSMKKILNGIKYTMIADEPAIKQGRLNYISVNNKILRSQFEAVVQSVV